MRLCSFLHENAARIGVVSDDGVVDLAAAAPELPREMSALAKLVGRPLGASA